LYDLEVLSSQGNLCNLDGIVFAVAPLTWKIIPGGVVVHGTRGNLGVDETWMENGRKKHSLFHPNMVHWNIVQAFILKREGFIIVTS